MPGKMMYGMKKDKKKRKGMVYGGMGRKKSMHGGPHGRKKAKHGGPHNNMDRIGMAMGGPNVMEVQEPN